MVTLDAERRPANEWIDIYREGIGPELLSIESYPGATPATQHP